MNNVKAIDNSFVKKQLASRSCVFVKLLALDELKKPMFFYLAVMTEKWDAFKQAIKKPLFNAKDHGFILYSDYGEPNEDIQKAIEIYYNITLSDIEEIPVS